jgi:phage terminase small subunit
MATRGAKPKPARLRLVDGTHNVTRHGKADEAEKAVEAADATFGKLVKPSYLKGQAAWAWKRYIEAAGWLDASREPAAIAFCELWQEFRNAPSAFPSSKHGQMRAYMSELGLTDERNRGDIEKSDEKDPFFGD